MKFDGCDYSPKMATLGFHTEICIMVVQPLFRPCSIKVMLVLFTLLTGVTFHGRKVHETACSTTDTFLQRAKYFFPKLVMGWVEFCLFVQPSERNNF